MENTIRVRIDRPQRMVLGNLTAPQVEEVDWLTYMNPANIFRDPTPPPPYFPPNYQPSAPYPPYYPPPPIYPPNAPAWPAPYAPQVPVRPPASNPNYQPP